MDMRQLYDLQDPRWKNDIMPEVSLGLGACLGKGREQSRRGPGGPVHCLTALSLLMVALIAFIATSTAAGIALGALPVSW